MYSQTPLWLLVKNGLPEWKQKGSLEGYWNHTGGYNGSSGDGTKGVSTGYILNVIRPSLSYGLGFRGEEKAN